jgi:hypothetical protein
MKEIIKHNYMRLYCPILMEKQYLLYKVKTQMDLCLALRGDIFHYLEIILEYNVLWRLYLL